MSGLQKALKIAGSQDKLSRLSGISQAAISKLSSGKSKMSATTAIKIESGLNGQVTRFELLPEIFGEAA